MATSGSTDFSLTRNEIIKTALLNIGIIGEGESPNATQYSDAAVMLNMIVKAWQADGMPAWAMKQTAVTLTATNSYNIGVGQTVNVARPLKVLSAFLRDTSATPDVDTTVNVLTRDEYNSLSSKSQTGVPTAIFYDPQGGATAYGTLYVWPLPDTTAIANNVLYITYQRPFEDFDAATDTPDFPQEWFLPLVWMLQWALAPSAGLPKDERKALLEEALLLKQQALNYGMEEGSVFIEPNCD